MRITQWKTKLAVSVAYLGLVALFYTFGLSCIFQSIFGISCPGCGMTRALLAALHLDFKAAFSLHPMFWSVPLLYLYFWLDDGIFPGKMWDRILLCVIGAGFVVNWILKLLP